MNCSPVTAERALSRPLARWFVQFLRSSCLIWVGLGVSLLGETAPGKAVLAPVVAHSTAAEPARESSTNASLPTPASQTKAPAPAPAAADAVAELAHDADAARPLNPVLRDSALLFVNSNLVDTSTVQRQTAVKGYQALLEEALQLKKSGNDGMAETLFVRLLQNEAPADLQKTALLALAVLAQERKDLTKAQQVYAQYLLQYPGDASIPEVLLRQGLLYREMGAPVMALSKFYAVMSSALNLKLDRLDYYQRLVLHAQSEIADTYFLQGKYEESAEFFSRLLKLNSPELEKSKILYKLVRSLAARGRHNEVVTQAGIYLNRYPESESSAEIRFLLAEALKKLGRNNEAMEQVLALLQAQQKTADQNPQNWAYWRQRTGNSIANQLYQEGDYVNALQVYQSLATLSPSPEWQVPALYQVGLVYERLRQPQKAGEAYDRILQQRTLLGTNALAPSLNAVLEMAKWRKGFLGWQERADASNQQLNPPHPTPSAP